MVWPQGFLPPDAAAKIGNVLQNYADGLALTRLGNVPRKGARHVEDEQRAAPRKAAADDDSAPADPFVLERMKSEKIAEAATKNIVD